MKITTAPFDALYELPPAVPSSPSTLAIVTTLPRSSLTGCCSSMRAIACLHTRNVPVRLTSSTRCHSSRSSRCAGPPPATPAAVTTVSRRPCSAIVASTAAAIAASSRTSAATNDTSGLPGRNVDRVLRLRQIEADYPRALLHEARDAREADPRGRARHERDLAIETSHQIPPRFRPRFYTPRGLVIPSGGRLGSRNGDCTRP